MFNSFAIEDKRLIISGTNGIVFINIESNEIYGCISHRGPVTDIITYRCKTEDTDIELTELAVLEPRNELIGETGQFSIYRI